jgi:Zn-dependent protease with chaperone function
VNASTVALMLAPLAVGVILAVVGRPLGDLLPPATAVPLLTLAGLVTALSTGFVLAVAGFEALAQLPVVASLGTWSARVVAAREPVPLALGASSALACVALMGAALRRFVSAGRDLAAAEATCRRLGRGTDGLIVLADDTPDAYALPGLSGRVVVSTGMLRALPAAERRVLLAHEAAHLRHRHHLYVQAAELSAAANPLLRPLARAVSSAVERWADEDAAQAVGERTVVARAVARASLAARCSDTGRVPGVGTRIALRMTDTIALVRTKAMLAPAPRPRHALTAAVLALTIAGAVGAIDTGTHTEHLFEVARAATTARS